MCANPRKNSTFSSKFAAVTEQAFFLLIIRACHKEIIFINHAVVKAFLLKSPSATAASIPAALLKEKNLIHFCVMIIQRAHFY
jgi:hypothetical protein